MDEEIALKEKKVQMESTQVFIKKILLCLLSLVSLGGVNTMISRGKSVDLCLNSSIFKRAGLSN